MFLARRPSAADIDRFLRESQELPVSYAPIGIVKAAPVEGRFDEQVVSVGHGPDDFERARAALLTWKQFAIGWVETFPRRAPVEPESRTRIGLLLDIVMPEY